MAYISEKTTVFFRQRRTNNCASIFLTRMLEKLNAPTIIQSIVEKEHLLQRNVSFEPINTDNFQHLPAWTAEDFLSFCGAYPFGFVKSYIGDQITKGKYDFQISKDRTLPHFSGYGLNVAEPVFSETKLLSRHYSNKLYCQFVLIDTSYRYDKVRARQVNFEKS